MLLVKWESQQSGPKERRARFQTSQRSVPTDLTSSTRPHLLEALLSPSGTSGCQSSLWPPLLCQVCTSKIVFPLDGMVQRVAGAIVLMFDLSLKGKHDLELLALTSAKWPGLFSQPRQNLIKKLLTLSPSSFRLPWLCPKSDFIWRNKA